ncbi:hypothetical protein HK096_010114 [Nowakowskiella sp. JEL0078]|nr:hypothetical protein HK096_010114 [Nowakowskiella sp. JEL0078]
MRLPAVSVPILRRKFPLSESISHQKAQGLSCHLSSARPNNPLGTSHNTPAITANVDRKPSLENSSVPKKIKKKHPPTPPIKIVLDESDLEEKFVKGSGPGGQKINKRMICVQLLHKPTGTKVETHRFRELFGNREEARKIMKRKLDFLVNGDKSRVAILIKKEQRRKHNAKSKTKKKQKAKITDAADLKNTVNNSSSSQLTLNQSDLDEIEKNINLELFQSKVFNSDDLIFEDELLEDENYEDELFDSEDAESEGSICKYENVNSEVSIFEDNINNSLFKDETDIKNEGLLKEPKSS